MPQLGGTGTHAILERDNEHELAAGYGLVDEIHKGVLAKPDGLY